MAVKCPKCQFENPPDVRFCVECGVKLEVICPQCGSPNAPTFKFCGKCGHDPREAKALAPIDCSKPWSDIRLPE